VIRSIAGGLVLGAVAYFEADWRPTPDDMPGTRR
jgi:hypothetical protein